MVSHLFPIFFKQVYEDRQNKQFNQANRQAAAPDFCQASLNFGMFPPFCVGFFCCDMSFKIMFINLGKIHLSSFSEMFFLTKT